MTKDTSEQINSLTVDRNKKAESIDKLNYEKMQLDDRLLNLGGEKRLVEEELAATKIRNQQQVTELNHDLNKMDLQKNNYYQRCEDLDRALQAREKECSDLKFDLKYANDQFARKEEEMQCRITSLDIEVVRCRENIGELERHLCLNKTN